MQYVNLSELLLEDNDTYTLNGQPFSGIAQEFFPSGRLRSEIQITDGWWEGISRGWYENGQLESEATIFSGGYNGPVREWFVNGQLKLEATFEHGICLESQEWDSEGNLTKEFRLDPSAPAYKELLDRRAFHAKFLA